MPSSDSDRSTSRRDVLRRSAVAGGAAVAATAAAALTAEPASAATGDQVKLGQFNTGEPTTLTGAVPNGAAPLQVTNPTGAQLRLDRGPAYGYPVPGAVQSTVSGLAVTGTATSGTNPTYEMLTTWNADMPMPIPPTRVLDTRTAAGQARLIDGKQDIDRTGRAVAGAFLVVQMHDLVNYGTGLLGNITVANTLHAGFATVWGQGAYPTASTINWWGPGQLLSNGVITQLGAYTVNGQTYYDIVAIAVASPTAIILDVTGFIVGAPWWIPSAIPAAAGSVGADEAGRKKDMDAARRRQAAKPVRNGE